MRHREDGAALHRRHREARDGERRADRDLGVRERAVGRGRVPRERDVVGLARVGDRGERRVLDVDELRGVGGGRGRLRHDRDHVLAREPHFAVGQRRLRERLGDERDLVDGHGREVGRGVHRHDAGRARGDRGVDALDAGVRDRRRHERQVQGVGRWEIGGEPGRAVEQRVSHAAKCHRG